MTTDELLSEIVQRIVAAFDPEAIILFGSRAYGEPDADSDIDLLVIADTLAHRSVFERHRAISDLFPRRRFALDVLVRTPAEMRELLEHGPSFFREITARGKVLYERRSHRMGVTTYPSVSLRAAEGGEAIPNSPGDCFGGASGEAPSGRGPSGPRARRGPNAASQ